MMSAWPTRTRTRRNPDRGHREIRAAGRPERSGNAAASNTFWVWAVAKNATDPKAAFDPCSWMASYDTEKKQTLADQQISAIDTLATDPEVLAATPPAGGDGGAFQRQNGPVTTSWGTVKEAMMVSCPRSPPRMPIPRP